MDGALVVTHHRANFGATQMRPIASDLTAGEAAKLTVDWMRMTPYPGSGTLTPGSSTAARAGPRTGRPQLELGDADGNRDRDQRPHRRHAHARRDLERLHPGSPTSGGDIPGNSRYVQYRAQLTSSDPAQTPTLSEVSIGYVANPDVTAPTITGRSPSPDATDVPRDTNVQVQFSEPMDQSTIDASACTCESRARAPTSPPMSATRGPPRRRPERRPRPERRLHGHRRRLGQRSGRQRARIS